MGNYNAFGLLWNLMITGSGGYIGGDDVLVFEFCLAVAAVVAVAGLILIHYVV